MAQYGRTGMVLDAVALVLVLAISGVGRLVQMALFAVSHVFARIILTLV